MTSLRPRDRPITIRRTTLHTGEGHRKVKDGAGRRPPTRERLSSSRGARPPRGEGQHSPYTPPPSRGNLFRAAPASAACSIPLGTRHDSLLHSNESRTVKKNEKGWERMQRLCSPHYTLRFRFTPERHVQNTRTPGNQWPVGPPSKGHCKQRAKHSFRPAP